jgi:hypothetical protein
VTVAASQMDSTESDKRLALGNWREVILEGSYAIKLPRKERAQGAMCLNRWEAEMWQVWCPKFSWQHLCPVVWAAPDGHILIMERAIQDVTEAEIEAFTEDETHPPVTCEYKALDWGHLKDGRLVVVDYGYACDNENEIQRQRDYYAGFPDRN